MATFARASLVLLLGVAPACELLANIPSYSSSTDSGTGGDSAATDGTADPDALSPECQSSSECTAPEVCVAQQCQRCDDDAHCGAADANVCLPDGTCASLDRIAYASPAGSGAACSLAMPCSVAQAFVTAQGSTTIDIVKLAAGTYVRGQSDGIQTTDTVILAGQGATFTATSPIQMLRVNTGGSLTIVGLTLVGMQQYNALCFGAAGTPSTLAFHRVISKSGAYGIGGFECTLALDRSMLLQNAAIGAYVSQGSARFTNSVVMGNGTVGAGAQGGLYFNAVPNVRIEMSSILGNATESDMTAGAITCGSSTTTITSSIIWGNTGAPLVVDAACTIDYSIVEPSYAGGAHNLRVDPLFLAAGEFHIQPTSPARGCADPALAVTVDADNQPRPQGAAPSDCGADQVQ